ncbi:VOC family protein [Sphingorhabdus sp.]|uniref:VOC family protein n=1 Tax=Sphingorhabdus sp. TaxID=1902408 RepID=UPI0032B863C9
MAQNFIEHVNVTVSNPERSAEMLIDLFDWHIRWNGKAQLGGDTIHVGNDRFYLAVYALKPGNEKLGHKKGVPLNHIGIVVDDLDEVERRVIARGLTPFSHGDYEPGRRFYFFDPDGIEFEIVSYG